MIYCLTGKIIKKSLDSVVISCAGVGYFVQIPATTGEAMPPAGQEGTVYTIMNVTENDVSLYGFATEEQRDCFKMLTGVTGVGPKAGLSILSIMTPEKVALAASSGRPQCLHQGVRASAEAGPAHRPGAERQGWQGAGCRYRLLRQYCDPHALQRPGPGRGRPRQPGLLGQRRRCRCGPRGRNALRAGDHHHCAAQPVARVTEGECRIEPGIYR